MRTLLCVATVAAITGWVNAITCIEPLPPLGGQTTINGEITEGTTVTAFCTNGGIMSGASSLTCINGMWQPPAFGICTVNSMTGLPSTSGLPTLPVTLPGAPILPGLSGVGTSGGAQCLPMLPPLGATLTPSSGSNVGLQNSGTVVTMRCNDNSMVTGASSATCINGLWQPPILGTCTPTVNAFPSLNIPSSGGNTNLPLPSAGSCVFGVIPPPNGKVVFSQSKPPYPAGSTAELTCDPGYTLKGSSMATCTNGLFSVLGTCEKGI